jgi:hypothetical protein
VRERVKWERRKSKRKRKRKMILMLMRSMPWDL